MVSLKRWGSNAKKRGTGTTYKKLKVWQKWPKIFHKKTSPSWREYKNKVDQPKMVILIKNFHWKQKTMNRRKMKKWRMLRIETSVPSRAAEKSSNSKVVWSTTSRFTEASRSSSADFALKPLQPKETRKTTKEDTWKWSSTNAKSVTNDSSEVTITIRIDPMQKTVKVLLKRPIQSPELISPF